jgi:hypothetical protein
MRDVLVALALGVVIGLIDVLPMLRIKVPRFSIFYLFAQWVFVAFVIQFIDWPIHPGLKGIILTLFGMTPMVIITYHKNRQKLLPFIITTVILGFVIGYAGSLLI